MAEQALAEHLALLARSGLMTHVAQLDPPVTAATMARFRADASAQSSNVMALSPGEFALCLAPNVRALASTVPHRLHPIGEHPLLNAALTPAQGDDVPEAQTAHTRVQGARLPVERPMDDAAAPPLAPPAGPSRRILPSALPASDAPSHAVPEHPLPAERSTAFAFTALSDPVQAEPPRLASGGPLSDAAQARLPREVQSLRTAQEALVTQMEGLAKHLGQVETAVERAREDTLRSVEETLSSQLRENLGTLKRDLVTQIQDTMSRFDQRAPAQREELAKAYATQSNEAKAAHTALQEQVAAALQAAEHAQRQRLDSLTQDLQSYGIARAEDEARVSEGFATLRLGLRAMNDRLADLSARMALPSDSVVSAPHRMSAQMQAPAKGTAGALPVLSSTTVPPMTRRISVVPPSHGDAADAGTVSEAPSPTATLRTALRSLLAELSEKDPLEIAHDTEEKPTATRTG